MTLHKHKCADRTCNRIWQHDDAEMHSDQEYQNSHYCPDCGREQRMRYFADEREKEEFSRSRDAERDGFPSNEELDILGLKMRLGLAHPDEVRDMLLRMLR